MRDRPRAAGCTGRRSRGLRLESRLDGAQLQQRKQEIAAQIVRLKDQLAERRAQLAAQRERTVKEWRRVDDRLLASIEQVGGTLESLLS